MKSVIDKKNNPFQSKISNWWNSEEGKRYSENIELLSPVVDKIISKIYEVNTYNPIKNYSFITLELDEKDNELISSCSGSLEIIQYCLNNKVNDILTIKKFDYSRNWIEKSRSYHYNSINLEFTIPKN